MIMLSSDLCRLTGEQTATGVAGTAVALDVASDVAFAAAFVVAAFAAAVVETFAAAVVVAASAAAERPLQRGQVQAQVVKKHLHPSTRLLWETCYL